MFDIYAPSALSGESLGRKRGVNIVANWIGPSEDKASTAFSIIWAVVCLSQLALLFQRLRKISPETSRKPFVFLGISVLCLMVHYIVYAIFVRTVWEYEIPIDTRNAISQTASFFYLINVALLPGVCLYLIHTRGNILSKTFTPITSQKWKKSFDFVMVGLLFVLSLAYFAFLAHDMNAVNHHRMSFDTWRARAGHLSRLNHATIAVKILIYIDVIVPSIVMFVQARKRQTAHAVRQQ
ncbi:hypothetical protein CPB86DRAFT_304750 [Serendipita vermifera]|nr:hypothetical protein CPB86DRAFT_304750 [Serendipita vermifera]